ncbi:hypothetical protein PIROE2DRAFT_59380 [Piromyces sp. E2]|nr:hypothetical protein PIROE2DRAFT_59380 [Piromyces sp. E2]|eukprot:OUM66402.1 hypothetical protein PIROE2DRAFT_59380 [Piromyces sp. E2]
MRDITPPHVSERILSFSGKSIEVRRFIRRCEHHFLRHLQFYGNDEAMKELSPNRKALYEAISKRFKNPEEKNITKMELMKLRHSWGKASEYLGKFSHYVNLIGCSNEIQLTIMLFQVSMEVSIPRILIETTKIPIPLKAIILIILKILKEKARKFETLQLHFQSTYLCEKEDVSDIQLPNLDPDKYPIMEIKVMTIKGTSQELTTALLDSGSTTNIIHKDLIMVIKENLRKIRHDLN